MAHGPIPVGGRTVDPGEEPGLGAGGFVGVAPELRLEAAGHPDAVLVHGEVAVHARVGEGPIGEEVVLVGGVDQASTEGGEEHVLPVLDALDDRGRLLGGVGAHPRLIGVVADPERDDRHGGELGVLVEDTGEGVVEDGT